ncbi:MAG: ankyrin repeat domain-containing protein [Smithellaceae bacterium]|nr:ankyrin repeat domain-containing protein [Smithellaceae bacterium]
MRKIIFSLFGVLLFLLILVFLPAKSMAESRMPPPDYPLLEAVKKGDVEKVKSILSGPPSASSKYEVNQKGNTGDMPLSVAARNGNLEIVKLLALHGAVVDAGKETGDRTPLIEASGQGHAAVVKYLIAKGADVNAKGKGLTPLLAASAWGRVLIGPAGDKPKTIRILLENGADVNVQDESWLKTGRTPLMYAVLQGDAALVQDFLAKGARLDLKNKDGETALSLAKKDGLEYIAQLLEKSAGGEPSPQADTSRHPLFKAIKEDRLDQVKAMVAKGADVNLRAPTGSTPLMYAADGNKLEMVRFLLNSRADVNAKNGANNTALIYASIKGHEGVVYELLSKKADVNVKNMAKGDALIYAVLSKRTTVVGLLLKHGAKVNDKYDDEKTALMMVVEAGSADIAKLLIAHKADVNAVDKNQMTALMIACEKGNADLVEALLKAGADINQKSKYGDTALSKAIAAKNVRIVRTLIKNSGNFDRREALFSAVIAGDQEIVKLLLTKDMDVNMRGFASGTALMLAADGDIVLVKFLVEKGADVNIKDDEGETALMKAVKSFKESNLSCIKYFIDHGADLNAVSKKGETALILAVKRGNADMVKILVEKRAAASLKDKEGKSAWTYAVEGANPAIVSLLEKAGAVRDYLGMEWKGNVSKQKEAFIKVVETPKEWSELWLRAFEKPAPDMDFEKYVVACVFLGHEARWLYSIGFSGPERRDGKLVIAYSLHDVMLRLSGPFQAGGQYHMRVFEKSKDVPMILEEAGSTSGIRR